MLQEKLQERNPTEIILVQVHLQVATGIAENVVAQKERLNINHGRII